MGIYDITLNIHERMTSWPGQPQVLLERLSKMEEGAMANVSRMEMSVHTGAHVDAPYHFLADGSTVEHLPLNILTGDAFLVELPEVDMITAEAVKEANIPPDVRRVLFKTRNSKQWATGSVNKFKTDYVALTDDAAQYLVDRDVQLVGADYLSVAPFDDLVPTHEILLRAGVVIVEGLDLLEVPGGRYTLYCLPLKLLGSDGAPARAILTD